MHRMGFLDSLFNMADKKELKNFAKMAEKINTLEPKFESMRDKELKNMTSGYTKKIEESISTDNSSALNDFNKVLNDIMNGFINDYDSNPRESVTKDDIVYKVISLNKVSGYVNEYINNDSVTNNLSELEKNYYVPVNVFKDTYKGLLLAFLNSYIGSYSANDSSFNDGTEVRVLFNKDLI